MLHHAPPPHSHVGNNQNTALFTGSNVLSGESVNINIRKKKRRIKNTTYEIHIFENPEEIRKHFSFSTKYTFAHFKFSI
jgi:hypothetical protein